MDFEGFREDLGGLLGEFGDSRAGPGRVLEGSSASLFGGLIPKGGQRPILEELGSTLKGF